MKNKISNRRSFKLLGYLSRNRHLLNDNDAMLIITGYDIKSCMFRANSKPRGARK